MKQVFTIMKIIGKENIENVQRKMSAYVQQYSQTQQSDKTGIKNFVGDLREAKRHTCVVYFCEFTDRWSMGDKLSRMTDEIPGFFKYEFGGLQIYCHTLPDGQNLQNFLVKNDYFRDAFDRETVFFMHVLDEARQSTEILVEESILIIIRDIYGATVTVEETIAASKETIEFLQD